MPNLIDIIQGIVVQAIQQYGIDGAQGIIHALVAATVGNIPFLGPIIEAIIRTLI
jgi:ABC-type enterochelin transport system permease subunit